MSAAIDTAHREIHVVVNRHAGRAKTLRAAPRIHGLDGDVFEAQTRFEVRSGVVATFLIPW